MLVLGRAISLQRAFSSIKLRLTPTERKSVEDYLGRVKIPDSIMISPTSENEVIIALLIIKRKFLLVVFQDIVHS